MNGSVTFVITKWMSDGSQVGVRKPIKRIVMATTAKVLESGDLALFDTETRHKWRVLKILATEWDELDSGWEDS